MYISNKLVGEHLRNARKRKGLTQARVAEELDISEKHYGHIERGARPASLEMLGHLCAFFEVPLEELTANILVEPVRAQTDRERDRQIESVLKWMQGSSDEDVALVAEIVEAIAKREAR